MTTSAEMIEGTPTENSVIVGGCHGLIVVPSAQMTDYYRAQGSVAAVGLLLLFLVLASLS